MIWRQWQQLEPWWRVCLEQAWEAYCSGSYPIGAVLVDENDAILATGRSRRFETDARPPVLAGHQLAHAEVNTLLAAYREGIDPATCRLYCTTEPCPLCAGAIIVAGVRECSFAARDTWAGSSTLLYSGSFVTANGVSINQTTDAQLQAIASILHCDRWLRHSRAAVEEMARRGGPLADQRIDIAGSQHADYLEATQACQGMIGKGLRERAPFEEIFTGIATVLA